MIIQSQKVSHQMIKKILFFISSLLVLIFVLLNFVNLNNYKKDILEYVNKNGDFEVSLEGDIKLRLLPSVALSLSHISVKPKFPMGFEHLKIERSDLKISWVDLLSGKINLDVIQVHDGEIILDAKNPANKIEKINLSASVKNLSFPIAAKGSLSYQNHDINFDGSYDLVESKFHQLDLTFSARHSGAWSLSTQGTLKWEKEKFTLKSEAKVEKSHFDILFDGSLTQGLDLNGVLRVNSQNPQSALTKLGLDQKELNHSFSLETKINAAGKVSFESIKCKVGDVKSEGAIYLVNQNKTQGKLAIQAWGAETKIDFELLNNFEDLEATFEGRQFDLVKVPFVRHEKIKSGVASFSGRIKTKIKGSAEAKAHLNGQTSVKVSGIKILTTDIEAIAQSLRNAKGIEDLGAILKASQKDSENHFETLEGKVEWKNGLGNVSQFMAKTQGAIVRGSGSLDLNTEQLNLLASLDIPETKMTGVGIKIGGSFSAPSFQLDEKSISKILMGMVTQKIEGEIKKHVGKALGETFGNILGEGNAKKPANENKLNPEKIIKGLFGG